MTREHGVRSGTRGESRDAGDADGSPVQAVDRRVLQVRRMAHAASVYNNRHPALVAEFTKLTGVDAKSFRAVRAWQLAHRLRGDGKIGPATVQAARAGEQPSHQGDHPADGAERKPTRTNEATANQVKNDEGNTVGADSDASADGEVLENPALMDNILDGSQHLEHAERPDATGEALKGAGETASRLNEAREIANKTEGVEGTEAPWIKAAMAPAIVELVVAGKYRDAAILLAKQFSPSEYFEGLLYVSEKLGIDIAISTFKWLVEFGTEANVLFAGMTWTYEGLKSIAEAHEQGDQKSRIRMYARAFADGFLYGEGADGGRDGAVTEEQRQAVELGLADGSRTAGQFGDLAPAVGRELLRRFKNDESALKHALMDGLMKRAGLSGIWS